MVARSSRAKPRSRSVNPHAVVIRTSWIYSAYGHNFVKTMLRLSATQPSVRVVDDQRGSPTSADDLADAILEIVGNWLRATARGNAGIYHLAGQGETTWHGFASAIFAGLARRGRRVPALHAITTRGISDRGATAGQFAPRLRQGGMCL